MIEQKLLVGRFIELNTPPPALDNSYAAPHGFHPVVRTVLHIEQSSKVAAPVQQAATPHGFNPPLLKKMEIAKDRALEHVSAQFHRQQMSKTGPGQVAKAHRNFVWLEWIPGKVSEVAPAGMDVLTGPMSGCWITTYTRNGTRYIGHVGTENDPTTQNSIDAKNAWNTYAAAATPGSFNGFDPFNDWAGAYPPGLPGESGMKMFALVTAAGQFYAIPCYPQTAKAKRIRVAGIQQLAASLPANGQIP